MVKIGMNNDWMSGWERLNNVTLIDRVELVDREMDIDIPSLTFKWIHFRLIPTPRFISTAPLSLSLFPFNSVRFSSLPLQFNCVLISSLSIQFCHHLPFQFSSILICSFSIQVWSHLFPSFNSVLNSSLSIQFCSRLFPFNSVLLSSPPVQFSSVLIFSLSILTQYWGQMAHII